MNNRDILLALLVIVIWAGNVIAIKFAVNEIPPLTAIALRFGLTALACLPFFRWPGRDLFMRMVVIAIMMGALHHSLLFIGMAYLPAGLTAILLQTQIIFSTLIGLLVFSEKIGWRSWFGIALGIGGIAIMYGDDAAGFSATGFWILIASTFCVSLAFMKMKTLPPIEPLTFLCLLNGIAFPFVFAASFIPDGGQSWTTLPDADWQLLTAVFAFQVLLVSASHVIWQQLLTRTPLSLLSPFTLLLPVCAVVLAILILDEIVTGRMLAGGVIAIAGVAIIVFRRAQKNTALPRCPAAGD